MATLWKDTPILNEKNSLKFLKKVEEDLKHPTYPKDTSKVVKAKKLLFEKCPHLFRQE